MHSTLDCRGQACPAPVMQVKELLEKEGPETITVVVDNEAAWENVGRFLEYQHFQVTTEREGGDIRLTARRAGGASQAMPWAAAPSPTAQTAGDRKIVVLVTSDRLGHGDDGLGAGLLLSFLKTVKEMGPDLWRLIFVNSGVTLTVEGAAALPALQELAEQGVTILVCGTCLNHFKLLEKKQVGQTTNMLDIVTAMQLADSVINL